MKRQGAFLQTPGFAGRIACLLFLLCIPFADISASGDSASVVFVEGLDTLGNRITLGPGVIVKEGYVVTNYHFVAGISQIVVYRQGQDRKYYSDGYLDVNESADLVLISVPFLKGEVSQVYEGDSLPAGGTVRILNDLHDHSLQFAAATIRGRRDVGELSMNELVARDIEECTGGPVFFEGKFAGLVTAGYRDGKWYAYSVPGNTVLPLLKRSFIIKDYSFLATGQKPGVSHFQDQLMESLTSVIWMSFEDAVKAAARKKKKILIDVYTDWCGWCKLMDKNSFGRKSIISYANENFYSVKLNAEGNDSISSQGRLYSLLPDLRVHELAWSLLRGNMSYPALVFIDEDGKVLTVVSGYLEPSRLEAALHFFAENAYRKPGMSFQNYEKLFLQRKASESND